MSITTPPLSAFAQEIIARAAKLSLEDLCVGRELHLKLPWPDGFVPTEPKIPFPTKHVIRTALAVTAPLAGAALVFPGAVMPLAVAGVMGAWWGWTQIGRLKKANRFARDMLDWKAILRRTRHVELAGKLGLKPYEFTEQVCNIVSNTLNHNRETFNASKAANPTDAKIKLEAVRRWQIAKLAETATVTGSPCEFKFVPPPVTPAPIQSARLPAGAVAVAAAGVLGYEAFEESHRAPTAGRQTASFEDTDDDDCNDYDVRFGVDINPTTGLPMIEGTMLDVGGHVYGVMDTSLPDYSIPDAGGHVMDFPTPDYSTPDF